MIILFKPFVGDVNDGCAAFEEDLKPAGHLDTDKARLLDKVRAGGLF